MSFNGKGTSGQVKKVTTSNKSAWRDPSFDTVTNSSTGTYSMASTASGSVIKHTATGTTTYELPTAVVGKVFHFVHRGEASGTYALNHMRVKPASGDRIVSGKMVIDNPGYVSLNKRGITLTLIAVDSTTWQVIGLAHETDTRDVGLTDTQNQVSFIGRDSWVAKDAANTAKNDSGYFSLANYMYSTCGINGVGTALNELDSYDNSADLWTSKTSSTTTRLSAPGMSLNDFGYVLGGINTGSPLNSTEKYNRVSNSWSSTGNLTAAKRRAAAGSLNGYGYYVNGTTNNAADAVTVVEKYNDSANTWTSSSNTPTAKSWPSVFTLGGFIYDVLGESTAGAKLSENVRFDDSGVFWLSRTSAGTARNQSGGCSQNDYGYIIAGRIVGADSNVVEEYNYVTNAWTVKAVSSSRSFAESCSINGYVYISHGGDTVLDTSQEYN